MGVRTYYRTYYTPVAVLHPIPWAYVLLYTWLRYYTRCPVWIAHCILPTPLFPQEGVRERNRAHPRRVCISPLPLHPNLVHAP